MTESSDTDKTSYTVNTWIKIVPEYPLSRDLQVEGRELFLQLENEHAMIRHETEKLTAIIISQSHDRFLCSFQYPPSNHYSLKTEHHTFLLNCCQKLYNVIYPTFTVKRSFD